MSLGASSVYVDGIMSAKLKRILKIIFGIYTRQQLDFFKVKLECQKYIYIYYIYTHDMRSNLPYSKKFNSPFSILNL